MNTSNLFGPFNSPIGGKNNTLDVNSPWNHT